MICYNYPNRERILHFDERTCGGMVKLYVITTRLFQCHIVWNQQLNMRSAKPLVVCVRLLRRWSVAQKFANIGVARCWGVEIKERRVDVSVANVEKRRPPASAGFALAFARVF